MKESLHFAHGNGFPSACYQQLFQHLSQHFDCSYLDRVGHTEAYPVTDNWDWLVEEVADSIRSQNSNPVIGLGHSLGGVLSFLAAIRYPELFKMIILLDSPIMSRLKSKLLYLSKVFHFIDRVTPASKTLGRREFWHNREEAVTYFKSKELFRYFHEDCLNDYIEYGMNRSRQGYTLRFDTRVEYEIYKTMPHILPKYEHCLRLPLVLIHGKQSDLITAHDLHYMKKYHAVIPYEITGTHMFPMEYPKETASAIMNAVTFVLKTKHKEIL